MQENELSYRNFIQQLLIEIPEFKQAHDEHLDFMSGEVLPHVLLGDFVRFLFDAYRKSTADTSAADHWTAVVERALDLMERAIQSPDEELQNLIGVSFVENLLPSDEEDRAVYSAIKTRLGPGLRHDLAFYDPS